MPATERIRSILMQPHLGKGHVLYTDNFYTSPSLVVYFRENQIHLCRTIRPNRQFYFEELTTVELEKSETAIYIPTNRQNKMLVCKFRDSKDKAGKKTEIMHMLSTCNQPNLVSTGKIDKDRNGNEKPTLKFTYGRS